MLLELRDGGRCASELGCAVRAVRTVVARHACGRRPLELIAQRRKLLREVGGAVDHPIDAGGHVAQRQQRVALALHVGQRDGDARIRIDLQRARLGACADLHPDRVLPRHDQRALYRAAFAKAFAGRPCRAGIAQIPHRAVHPGGGRRVADLSNHPAALLGDRDAHAVFRLRRKARKAIVNQRAIRRVRRRERPLPKIAVLLPHLITNGRTWLVHERIAAVGCGSRLLHGRDVIENPDAPSVRRQNQVVVTRMDDQIPHRHRRQIVADGCPVSTAVLRGSIPRPAQFRSCRNRRIIWKTETIPVSDASIIV